jgi:hypothetical protein
MRTLLLGLAIAAAAVGAGVGYAGMQTASLPEWYESGKETATSDTAAQGNDSGAVYRPENGVDANGNQVTVIPAGQLNDMVQAAIASQPYTAPILDVAKGVNTSIEDGRIESGAVINLNDLPTASLPAEGQAAIAQLTQTFPFLANRDVYLGVEGSPKVVDGSLSLDDTHIKLGQLKLPMASVADQLGLSQAELEQQVGALLDQQGLTLESVEIVDGQLVLVQQP